MQQMMDSKLPASSGEALSAFGPLWTALMVATGVHFLLHYALQQSRLLDKGEVHW